MIRFARAVACAGALAAIVASPACYTASDQQYRSTVERLYSEAKRIGSPDPSLVKDDQQLIDGDRSAAVSTHFKPVAEPLTPTMGAIPAWLLRNGYEIRSGTECTVGAQRESFRLVAFVRVEGREKPDVDDCDSPRTTVLVQISSNYSD